MRKTQESNENIRRCFLELFHENMTMLGSLTKWHSCRAYCELWKQEQGFGCGASYFPYPSLQDEGHSWNDPNKILVSMVVPVRLPEHFRNVPKITNSEENHRHLKVHPKFQPWRTPEKSFCSPLTIFKRSLGLVILVNSADDCSS